MLRSLHIRNLALVREIDVSFGKGLNILTGETGAGKSVLIGSIGAALGGRFDKTMLRPEGDALIECTFEIEPDHLPAIEEAGIVPEEDGTLLIKRRISEQKSVFRIGDETFSAAKVREIAPHLIDIYGQNEYRTLLDERRQLMLIDEYADAYCAPLAAEVKRAYGVHEESLRVLRDLDIGEDERLRRLDLISYEIREIEEASPRTGEDEELETEYRRISNAQKIASSLGNAAMLLSGDEGAADAAGRAVRLLLPLSEYDTALGSIAELTENAEMLLSDAAREIDSYLSGFEYDEERLQTISDRLDTLNRLKRKYGGSIEKVIDALEERQKAAEELSEHERYLRDAKAAEEASRNALAKAAEDLREARKKGAAVFREALIRELRDLNFAQVRFEIAFSEKESIGPDGADRVEFLISFNPGEELRPLRLIASGGELSRCMLGVRTLFAAKEDTGTMIFDEIDAGISGKTAQKVAQKLSRCAQDRQVLAITHLPQIAAMADHHYLIEKRSGADYSETLLYELDNTGSVDELARMIGGEKITPQILSSAAELKTIARKGNTQ